jgi:hypothetical protein
MKFNGHFLFVAILFSAVIFSFVLSFSGCASFRNKSVADVCKPACQDIVQIAESECSPLCEQALSDAEIPHMAIAVCQAACIDAVQYGAIECPDLCEYSVKRASGL